MSEVARECAFTSYEEVHKETKQRARRQSGEASSSRYENHRFYRNAEVADMNKSNSNG